MAELIHCPQCERPLRIPEELFGQNVKCPSCGTVFVAPTGGAAHPAPPSAEEQELGQPEAGAALVPEPAEPRGAEPAAPIPPRPSPRRAEYREDYEDYDEIRPRPDRSERAKRRLLAPAICLLITGVLGLVGQGWFLLRSVVSDEAMLRQQMGPPKNAEERQAQDMVIDIFRFLGGQGGVTLQSIFLFISLLVILAGIMMLFARMRWLAITGSILAMVNLHCLCCVLGLPFGIWSLAVLANPEVKAAFT